MTEPAAKENEMVSTCMNILSREVVSSPGLSQLFNEPEDEASREACCEVSKHTHVHEEEPVLLTHNELCVIILLSTESIVYLMFAGEQGSREQG